MVTPFFVDSDAVCNDVYHSVELLRSAGYDAQIFAISGQSSRATIHRIDDLARFVRDEDDIVYYHFSTGRADVLNNVAQRSCRKILKFHNITPASLFSVWSDELAEACRAGYDEIRSVAQIKWNIVLADSEFNLAQIKPHLPNTTMTEVLPPFHEVDALLGAGKVRGNVASNLPRVLNVGRLVQSKGHPFLLRVIRYLIDELDTPVILDIVGKPDHRLLAYQNLLEMMVREYQIGEYVNFHGGVDAAALASLYSAASAYLCTSEHEGFCVPIVEAMAFGVPVVALDTSAIAGTVGDAGIVWPERDARKFAVTIHHLLNNETERRNLGGLGKSRYETCFSNRVIADRFLAMLARL